MSNEAPNKIGLINFPEIPDSIDNALNNLTDCPTKNAGQTFGDLWYLVFGGISHAADKRRMKYASDLEKYHQELTKSIDQIPDNQKIDPSIQVTAQALENSKYCVSSESLRNMFVKLISGTMNSNLEPFVHPSFPEIIKQMDEKDAHILMELKSSSGEIPIAEFREELSNDGSFITHFTNAYISTMYKLSLNDCSCSLSSLTRMGLISISYSNHFKDDSLYKPFYETPEYRKISKDIHRYRSNSKLFLGKGICSITPLGKRFIHVCI